MKTIRRLISSRYPTTSRDTRRFAQNFYQQGPTKYYFRRICTIILDGKKLTGQVAWQIWGSSRQEMTVSGNVMYREFAGFFNNTDQSFLPLLQ